MNYDKYKSRIMYIAKIVDVIKKFRVLILSVVLAVTAIVTGLLAARGTVYGEDSIPTQITYGEQLSLGADAFMSHVSYEFRREGDGEWTTQKPTRAGKYQIRPVAEATFGGKRYGDVCTLTILPKNIVVEVQETELIYGETPTLGAALVAGDSIVCEGFEYIGLGEESVSVRPLYDGIKITDGDGNDVTGCYAFALEEQILAKQVELLSRPISLDIPDASRVYDGTPFTSEQYTLEESALAFNDEFQPTFHGSVINVGERVQNTVTATFVNADGVDVSKYYNVNVTAGWLSVEKRPILLKTESKSEVYNGTPLTAPDYTYGEEELVSGHVIETVSAAEITRVGETPNVLTVRIWDGTNDVTGNYNISFPETAMLTVTERPITLTSEDFSRAYDATPLRHESADITEGTLAEGDEIGYSYTGSITYVGTAKNTFTAKIVDENDEDVTFCYKIVYADGTLEITPAAIEIRTDDAQKPYDGTPLTCQNANVTNGQLFGDDELLLSNAAAITYVKETKEGNNTMDILITSEEIMKNYAVTITYGTLTITPREIVVTATYAEKIYDGTPLTSNAVTVDIEMPAGHTLTAKLLGSQTNAGESDNVLLAENVTVYIGEEYTKEGDVTDNFNVVSTQNNLLVVTPREITVTSGSASKVYDGTALVCHEHTITSGSLAPNQRITTLYAGKQTEANADDDTPLTLQNNAFTVRIDDADWNPVTANYSIELIFGTLQVWKRAINVKTASYEWEYDGYEHFDTKAYGNADLSDEKNPNGMGYYATLAENQRLVYDNPPTVINVLSPAFNDIVFRVLDAEDNDVTSNYAITVQAGKLEITPRKITFTSGSAEKTYDGTALTYDFVDVTDGALADNQSYQALVSGSQTNANEDVAKLENNTFTVRIYTGTSYTQDGDTTSNYEITYLFGDLRVYRREVQYYTRDIEWIYDGEWHFQGGGYYSDDELANGTSFALDHILIFANGQDVQTIGILNVGTKENKAVFVVSTLSGDRSIESNYNVVCLGYGTLTILPRPLLVQRHDLSWTYDGEAHYDGDGTLYDSGRYTNEHLSGRYTLVNRHTFKVESVADEDKITNVGTKPNTVTLKVYNGDDPSVNGNYEISYLDGTLTVTPRPVTLKANYQSVVYDGQPHRAELGKHIVTMVELVKGHTSSLLTVCEEIVDVGTTPHEAVEGSGKIVDENGVDVTSNYSIAYANGTFEIVPRKIKIQAHSHEWTYDGEWHGCLSEDCAYTSADLVKTLIDNKNYFDLVTGHALTKQEPASQMKDVLPNGGTCPNTLAFSVWNGTKEVTSNYVVEVEEGTLKILPREITIKTHAHEWTYDGLLHGCGADDMQCTYKAEDVIVGSLVDGHKLRMTHWATVRDYKDNEYFSSKANTISFVVVDENGETVNSDNYKISEEGGPLTIKKRVIEITTETCYFTYDGSAQRDTIAYNKKGYDLIAGHTLVIDAQSSITNVSESGKDNIIAFLVHDENGKDVSDNYDLQMTYGKLYMNPRVIHVLASSRTAAYNGELQRFDTKKPDVVWLYGSVVETHTLHVSEVEYETEAISLGTTEVLIKEGSVCITDNNSKDDVTANYEIVYNKDLTETIDPGEFTVVPRQIAVQAADSFDNVYNGSPYTIVKGAHTIVGDIMVEGHVLTVDTLGATRTEVGETPHEIVEGSAVVKTTDGATVDKFGNNLSDCYVFTYSNGTLKVVSHAITITSDSISEVYDGTARTCENCFITGELLDGHTLEMNYLNSQTIPGKIENAYTFVIKDANGNDVTRNYAVTQETGWIVVTPRPITVETGSAEKYYDGEPLTCSVVNYDPEELAPGHTIELTVNGSQTEVGRSDNTFAIVIKNADGEEVTEYYQVDQALGTLLVKASPTDPVVMFYVTADKTGNIYLRDQSYGDYSATTGVWGAATTYTASTVSPLYFAGLAIENSGAAALGATAVNVKLESTSQTIGMLPYMLPYYVTGSEDSGTGDLSASYMWLDSYEISYYAYEGRAASLAGSAYASLESAYRAYVNDTYLSLPTTTYSYMRSVIEAQGWNVNTANVIDKVAQYIQNAAIYDLEYDTTLDSAGDVAVAFLRDYKTGVCRHYASAATAMFRALGIPARYTTGYLAKAVAGEKTEVDSMQGHAWVEVYINGMGWVNVEVTGGSQQPSKIKIEIKPKDVARPFPKYSYYDASENPVEIVDVDGENDFSTLLENGYNYTATVTGAQYGVGKSPITITSFTLFDAAYNDVTDSVGYEFVWKEGTIELVEKLLQVEVEESWKYYDGTPLTYGKDAYFRVIKENSNGYENVTVVFDSAHESLTLTNAGTLESTAIEACFHVYDETGKEVTEEYVIDCVNFGLEIKKRIIHIKATDVTATYDESYQNEPLTSSEVEVVFGKLVSGHRIEAETFGSLSSVGEVENVILAYAIFDANSNGMTDNYYVEKALSGKLILK